MAKLFTTKKHLPSLLKFIADTKRWTKHTDNPGAATIPTINNLMIEQSQQATYDLVPPNTYYLTFGPVPLITALTARATLLEASRCRCEDLEWTVDYKLHAHVHNSLTYGSPQWRINSEKKKK